MLTQSLLLKCILLQLSATSLIAKYTIESTSLRPDYAVVAILDKCGEFHLNAHVDLSRRVWLTDQYSSCSQGAKDALDYCQRVYPGLEIVNVVKIATTDQRWSFRVRWCDEDVPIDADVDEMTRANRCRTVSNEENATIYKCLHGTYTPVNLAVPRNCLFSQFSNQKDCPTDVEWMRLMKNRCTASQAYLREFRFMQWCNALNTGARLSSFVGVEFVCCNATAVKPPQSNQEQTNPPVPNEDDNIDYVNEESSNVNKLSADDLNKPEDENESSAVTIKPLSSDRAKKSGVSFLTILMALLVFFTVCVVIYNRRRKRLLSNQLMVPVDANNGMECPEMNHINRMQVNGYENPTYKYFEVQS